MAKIPKSTLPTRSDAEVAELALAIFRGDIFTDRHIAPSDAAHLFGSIFMPLSLMDKRARLHMQRKLRPALLYAPMSAAGPRAINGYPMFFEVHMLHQEDADRVWAEYKRLQEATQPGILQEDTTP